MDVAALSSVSASGLSPAMRASSAAGMSSFGSAAKLKQATPAEQRAAVGAQFEAIMIRQMLAKPLTSMLGSSEGTSATVYGDLLADTLANQLAAGRGLGIGRLLENQLAPRDAAANPSHPLSHR